MSCAILGLLGLASGSGAWGAAHSGGTDGAAEPDVDPSKGATPGYDPLRGVDADGRIPKVQLPPTLHNPGRWRYIPEGRIKRGNIFERFTVSTFIVPLFFYEQDIGAGGGVSVTDIDFRQQRRREFAGTFLSYTTEGQQRYRLVWQRWLHHRNLEEGGVALEERSFVRATAGYERTLTRRFFGFGPDTVQSDETSYTEEVFGFGAVLQGSVPHPGDDFVLQVSTSAERHNLAEGHVSSVPSTNEQYPRVFDEADSFDVLWVGALARFDTRDSQHAPYRGFVVEAGIDAAPLQSAAASAAVYTVKGSVVIPLPGLFHDGGDSGEENPPTDTVALGGQVRWVDGDLPFWALPTLGGRNTLRGYIENRFTGRALWHASTEYRFWTVPRGFTITDTIRVERVGAAVFYDIGTVSGGLNDLWSADVHDSYGVSVRFSLERLAQFRADLGFSDEGTNFTFAYGLSF